MTDRTKPKWLFWLDAFRGVVSGQGILFLTFTAACVGLLHARALLSIFSGILFGVAALNLLLNRHTFSELYRYRALIALMAVFLVYLFSGLQSEDLTRWSKITWDNVLFVIIPVGFYIYRDMPAKTWLRLLMIYVLITALSAMSVTVDYLLHFEAYNELYRVGKTIPTPIIHVRYSYFTALAACISFALGYEQSRIAASGLRFRFLLGVGIFLTIFVHILAVRTGLIALYGGLMVMWLSLILKEGKWRIGLISAGALIVLVFIAFNAFPSVANKIGYVLYDLNTLQEQGARSEYSDNVRITSIRHGLTLINEQLITGTGIGDLNAEMDRIYQSRTPEFPPENRYPPISQYIYTLAAFGVVGACLYFCFLLYPMFSSRFSYVLLAIYATTLWASFGETTIELQLGKTAFIMLVCIGVLHVRSQEPTVP